MERLPPLNALRAFEAAARRLSFKKAAEELCVTPGAVSRHVGNLEEFLGTTLFLRQHRNVAMTAAGQVYLKEIQGALRHIAQATDAVIAGQDERMLRLRVPPTFAVRWLVPRLAKFHAQNPGIAVQVTTSHDLADFDADDVDAAIQYGEGWERGLVAELLFRECLAPVCSGHHRPRPGAMSVEELAGQVLLHSFRRPNDWPRWFAAAGAPGVVVKRSLVLENSSLTYQGALDGLGVAIAQLPFVRGELEAGRLVMANPLTIEGRAAYFLAYPRRAARLGKIRHFHRWIAREAELTRAERRRLPAGSPADAA